MSATRFTPIDFSGGSCISSLSSLPRLPPIRQRLEAVAHIELEVELEVEVQVAVLAVDGATLFGNLPTFVWQMAATSAYEERVVRSGAQVVLLAAFSTYSFGGRRSLLSRSASSFEVH